MLPPTLQSAPIYAISEGSFVVDSTGVQNLALTPPTPPGGSGSTPLTPQQPDPPVVYSNAWYSQVVISNHTYVSFNTAFLDANGQPGNTVLPPGVMFPLTSTNLTIPLPHWQPITATNPIQAGTFNLPYTANLAAVFYDLELQIDPTFDTNSIPPFSAVATDLHLVSDKTISLQWTNNQPADANEQEAIVEFDSAGHSYLVESVITTGANGAWSFELPSTNGLSFIRHWAPANAPGDQFYLLTNYLNNMDVFTVPYIVDITSGRTIIDVSAYDVTDPQNEQFLGHVSAGNCFEGTLEIPGLSIHPGVVTIEFRALDAGGGLTATDVVVTNNRTISVISPIFQLVTNGSSRVATSLGGYKIAFEAVTTATSGTWEIEIHNPDGSLAGTSSAPISSVGQDILFDDGGTVSTIYPVPYYQVDVSVHTPNATQTNVFWVTLIPPRGNAASITGYDTQVLPSNSSDRQFVLSILSGEVSGLFNFIYYTVDFGSGYWNVVSHPSAISLDANWGWRALQAGLSGTSYEVGGLSPGQWITNQPDRPILGVAVESHGGEENGTVVGLQGPANMNDAAVTAETLQNWGFSKPTNAVAIAVLTGCQLGNSPFMTFILRNQGVSGQISSQTASTKGIRPCFGLGWTTETYVGTDQFGWVSYWALYATELSGSSFAFSLDNAFAEANQSYFGNGGTGAIWSGTTGMTLDQFAQ